MRVSVCALRVLVYVRDVRSVLKHKETGWLMKIKTLPLLF